MKNKYLLLTVLLIWSFGSFAQRSNSIFIESLNENEVSFSTNQQNKYQRIRSNDMYKQVSLVRIGNLSTLQKRGALPLNIPGRNGKLVAIAKSVKSISETEYVWIGEFIKEEGTVMIIAKEGRVFGHITVNDDAYEIHDLGNQINILVQINDEKYSEEECATIDRETTPKEATQTNTKGRIQSHIDVIRVLALFTPNAENSVANINDVATLAIQQMNTALVNSGVPNADVALAGVQELSFTESPIGDIWADVQSLTNDINAQTFRNNFEADVVILLTNGNYGSTFGVVRAIGPINNQAYGIVEVDAAAGRFTFIHEVAHLVGARHNDDPNPTFAHGHNFKTGVWPFRKTRKTILNSLSSGESRILYYSNPDVEYQNKDTGTSSRDNGRQFDEQSTTVAAFRNFTPPLAVSISGPLYGNNAGTYTWSSSISNGVSPFTYQWDYSTDGFNYSFFGTSSSKTAQLPFNNDLYLRLTVTDNNGDEAVDFHFSSNSDGDDCIKCLLDESYAQGDSILAANNSQFVIYPNPTVNEVNLLYKTIEPNTTVSFIAYDYSGNIVLSDTLHQVEKGIFTKIFDVSSLKLGQYILKLHSGENVETKRLIISK